MDLSDCRLVDLPHTTNSQGSISSVDGNSDVPFEIRRAFYVYDIPPREKRGAHAHKTLEEIVVCLFGSLDVIIDDGMRRASVHLDLPHRGLYIPPLIWCHMENFSNNVVYLVIASAKYDERDYIRSYGEFLKAVKASEKRFQ